MPKPKAPVLDRSLPGVKSVYDWDAITGTVTKRVEERVKHELRSAGGKKAAQGERGEIKRQAKKMFVDLTGEGLSATDAIRKISKALDRSPSTIRKHVANLR